VAERARQLLLTHEGRIALSVVYMIAAAASIITYTIVRSPLYGLGQLALTAFGLIWARGALRRA